MSLSLLKSFCFIAIKSNYYNSLGIWISFGVNSKINGRFMLNTLIKLLHLCGFARFANKLATQKGKLRLSNVLA